MLAHTGREGRRGEGEGKRERERVREREDAVCINISSSLDSRQIYSAAKPAEN